MPPDITTVTRKVVFFVAALGWGRRDWARASHWPFVVFRLLL